MYAVIEPRTQKALVPDGDERLQNARGATPLRLLRTENAPVKARREPASLICRYGLWDLRDNTLGPDNGGVSGLDYLPLRGFGGQLPVPFSTGAGIGLSARTRLSEPRFNAYSY
jgi:hypothetical protein